MRSTAENYEITQELKFWNHEKNFGPKKYPRENILDLRNTYKETFYTHEIPTRK